MNPFRLVRRLLEDGMQMPADPDDDVASVDSIKDFANYAAEPHRVQGIPITGFYRDLQRKTQGKRLVAVGFDRGTKVEHNTWIIVYPDGRLALRLHRTDIITVTPDDTLTVSTGGWQTKLTLGRLADWLPGGWRIYTKDGTWYWWNYKNENASTESGFKTLLPFSDGDRITADGTLIPQLPSRLVKVRKPRNV